MTKSSMSSQWPALISNYFVIHEVLEVKNQNPCLQMYLWSLKSSSQAGPVAPGSACWPALAAVVSGCPGK